MMEGNGQCHSDDECPHPLRCCGGMVGSPSTTFKTLKLSLSKIIKVTFSFRDVVNR